MKIPNLLTVLRMALAPVFILLFTAGTRWGLFGALVTAILFEATDIADGAIARGTHQVSDLGKFLDPMADSLSRFTVFLCFLWADYASVWAVAIVFYRDTIVAALRILGATKSVIISARWSGKMKAICQGTGFITILCFAVWPALFEIFRFFGIEGLSVRELARIVTWILAAITFGSLCDYLWGNRKILAALRE